jgi:hypothetical protein
MAAPNNPFRVVAGTGHRELHSGDPAWLADRLPQACTWLRDTAGMQYGISGMALGFDMDWAEAILDARMKLCVVIPFLAQPDRWSRAQRTRWQKLRAAADREHILGQIPDDLTGRRRGAVVNRLLFDRNHFMCDHAGALITDWEPGRFGGGTTECLFYASQRTMPGVWLDPVNRKVNLRLPADADLEPFTLLNTRCGHIALVSTRTTADKRLTELTRAGYTDWRTRHAQRYEHHDDGCDDCIEQLALSAQAAVAAGMPL